MYVNVRSKIITPEIENKLTPGNKAARPHKYPIKTRGYGGDPHDSLFSSQPLQRAENTLERNNTGFIQNQ